VNSTVTVSELANRVSGSNGLLSRVAFRGVVLATAAMLVRNGVILGLFSPAAFRSGAIPLVMRLAGLGTAVLLPPKPAAEDDAVRDASVRQPMLSTIESPFSPLAALKFGVVFLGLQIAGTLAQRSLGSAGFYAVSIAGGLVSSASAVASAASLAGSGALSPVVAAAGAVLASAASALIDVPLVARIARDRLLTRQVAIVVSAAVILGLIGLFVPSF